MRRVYHNGITRNLEERGATEVTENSVNTLFFTQHERPVNELAQ